VLSIVLGHLSVGLAKSVLRVGDVACVTRDERGATKLVCTNKRISGLPHRDFAAVLRVRRNGRGAREFAVVTSQCSVSRLTVCPSMDVLQPSHEARVIGDEVGSLGIVNATASLRCLFSEFLWAEADLALGLKGCEGTVRLEDNGAETSGSTTVPDLHAS